MSIIRTNDIDSHTNYVVDNRPDPWFKINHAIIDIYGDKIGVQGIALYACLARYANSNKQCFPSIRTIAKKIGISPPTVGKYLTILEDLRLIARTRRTSTSGDRISTIYTILAVEVPKGGVQTAYTPVKTVCTEEELLKKKNLRSSSKNTGNFAAEESVPYTDSSYSQDIPENEEGEVTRGGAGRLDAASQPGKGVVSDVRNILGDAEDNISPTPTNLPLRARKAQGRGADVVTDAPLALPLTTTGFLSPEELITLYNDLTPEKHPKIRQVSPGRLAKATTYLRLFPEPAFWRTVFTAIGSSQFLQGHKPGPGHGSFIANFEWLLSRGKDGTENCVKVAEGKYTDPAFLPDIRREASQSHQRTREPVGDPAPPLEPLTTVDSDALMVLFNSDITERSPHDRR